MRWIALALILMSLPVLMAWLNSNPANRDRAMLAMGLLLFMVGDLQMDAAIMTWPTWPGTSKGILLSPIDALALALIATRSARNNRVPFALLAILWIVPTALSIAVSKMAMASFFVLVQNVQLIIFATAIAGEVARPVALQRLLQGISIGLIVQAGYVIQQKLTGTVQATGTLDHQNSLGLMIELAVLPLLGYLLEGGRSKLAYAGVAAGLIAVASGGSRGTLLFVTIGIVVLVLFSLSRGMTAHKGKILGVCLAVAAVAVPLSLATLEKRFGESTMITEETEREAFANAARAIAADHVLGSGANTYVMVANTEGYSQRAGVVWNQGSRASPVHNAFLLTRAETGRLGEWFLYLLIGVCAWRGLIVGRRLRVPGLNGVVLGAGAASVAVLAHNHYEYAFAFSHIQRLFWLSAGIIFAGMIAERRLASADRKQRVTAARARASSGDDTVDSAPGHGAISAGGRSA